MKKSCICIFITIILLLSMLAGCSMQKCTICHNYGATHRMFDDILCDDCYEKINALMAEDDKSSTVAVSEPQENPEEKAEEKAFEALGTIISQVSSGTYKSLGNKQGKMLEDLSKEYPANELIMSCYSMNSAIFWRDCMDGMSSSDDGYSSYQKDMEEALVQVNIELLPEYSDFIKEFISTTIGMPRYNELAPGVMEKLDNIAHLSKEDKLNILVEVFSRQDALGDNATDAQVEEIWSAVCEEYKITRDFLFELFLDGDLSKQAYAQLEDSKPKKNQSQNTTDEFDSQVPREYNSALIKAENYGSMMHMSKAAIYDQLVSEYGEQFSPEAAQYAVDNVVMDWNENALAKADSYSDTMHMSKKAIYDQLTSEFGEKFTAEEAQYAVDNIIADWKSNALQKAISYQDTMAMSPNAIYDQLVSPYGEQFTAEEAQYAVDNLNK